MSSALPSKHCCSFLLASPWVHFKIEACHKQLGGTRCLALGNDVNAMSSPGPVAQWSAVINLRTRDLCCAEHRMVAARRCRRSFLHLHPRQQGQPSLCRQPRESLSHTRRYSGSRAAPTASRAAHPLPTSMRSRCFILLQFLHSLGYLEGCCCEVSASTQTRHWFRANVVDVSCTFIGSHENFIIGSVWPASG